MAVNAGFELAQHPQLSPAVARQVVDALGPTGLARTLADDGLRGTFDPADLLAATAVALAAAGCLRLAFSSLEHKHAH